MHTLKGAARVFGFSEIQDIAHRIEDIFEGVAEKRAVFSSFMAERIFKGLDAIRTLLEKIVQRRRDRCRCIGSLQGAGSVPRRETRDRKAAQARERTKEGERGGRNQRKARKGRSHREKGRRTRARSPVGEGAALHPPAQREEYIRVPLSRVDKLLYLVGEVVINKMKSSAKIAQAKRLSKLSKEAQKSISSLNEAIKKEVSSREGDVTRLLSQCDAQIQKLREHTLKLYDDVSTENTAP